MTFPAEFLQFNRPHKVSPQTADFLYRLYFFVCEESSVTLRAKERTFESTADSNQSWRVVCVSEAALNHMHNTRTAKGLKRAHPVRRMDRAKFIFQRSKPLGKRSLLRYFFQNDTVALVLDAENNKDGFDHWSPLIAVPHGVLMGGSFSKYSTRADLAWVDEVIRQRSHAA